MWGELAEQIRQVGRGGFILSGSSQPPRGILGTRAGVPAVLFPVLFPGLGGIAQHSQALREIAILFALVSAKLIASGSGVTWLLTNNQVIYWCVTETQKSTICKPHRCTCLRVC